ncbi:hypothetical protein BGZ73_000150 [Actinomortierella ambigua]|nr:hypothetical protein BGZ73_000150 [Actinomortierella ambigua]
MASAATAAKSFAQFYNRRYQKHPILTISVTNALLAGLSDTLTQKYFSPSQPISITHHSPPPSDQQQLQWTSSAAVSSYGESLTTGLPGNHTSSNTSDTDNHIRPSKDQPLKGGQLDAVVDSAKNYVDRIKTVAHQAPKDVVHEDDEQPAQTRASTRVQNTVLKSKDKTPPASASTPGMLKEEEKTNQSLEAFEFDYPRLSRFMFYNFAIAPVIHTWYSYIDRVFPLSGTPNSLASGATATGGRGGAATRGMAAQAMHAARKAFQPASLSGVDVPSHKGSTPLPTTRNPTGMNPSGDMAKAAVNKVAGAASKTASATASLSKSTWLQSTLQPALRRMLADQILFAPVGLAMLFTALTVLEGGGAKEIHEKLNESYPAALKANYTIWPIVQLVNFSIMPLQFRLPFVSAVGIAWNAYLSLVNNRGRQTILVKEQQEHGYLHTVAA